jgi:hypothetical protein
MRTEPTDKRAETPSAAPQWRSPAAQLLCAGALWVALLGLFAGSAAERRETLRGLVFSCVGGLCLEDEAGRIYRFKGKGLDGFKGQLVEINGFVRRERGELRLRALLCQRVEAPASIREALDSSQNPAMAPTTPPASIADGRDFQG